MKLSIIVPVYNMASDGKLNYCLDSLAAQTISDYEVITVDDASTDKSFSILLEYEKKYPGKFKAVHSEVNKRQGGAKNIGLSLAKGEWIGFIDSDDWILPTMYEKLIGRAEETGADMVGCDYCLTDEHSMKIGKRVKNGKAEKLVQPAQTQEAKVDDKTTKIAKPAADEKNAAAVKADAPAEDSTRKFDFGELKFGADYDPKKTK